MIANPTGSKVMATVRPTDCTSRSCNPAAIPSRSRSIDSANSASASGSQRWFVHPARTRNTAITRALEPARPTERGIDVDTDTSTGGSAPNSASNAAAEASIRRASDGSFALTANPPASVAAAVAWRSTIGIATTAPS